MPFLRLLQRVVDAEKTANRALENDRRYWVGFIPPAFKIEINDHQTKKTNPDTPADKKGAGGFQ